MLTVRTSTDAVEEFGPDLLAAISTRAPRARLRLVGEGDESATELRSYLLDRMDGQLRDASQRIDVGQLLHTNRDPILPLADDSVDAAMICVSIQYLQRPLEVLREVRRVLRPGGPIVISFSNRCFWTKAVAVWRALDDDGHARLVEHYLRHTGFAEIEIHRLAEWVEDECDPMIAVVGRAPAPTG